MNCKKCNEVMKLRHVMQPDGSFVAVWECPKCKDQQYAIGRRC